MSFSLSYNQLFQAAEAEIKKCDLRQSGRCYAIEIDRASVIVRFWFLLALRGYSGLPDMERIEVDMQRLEELILSRVQD
ncbi:hypothetical protein [Enterobacter sichuanensis]|uniref:hypothetical protein n=1 Tax=Enterobacter sichuanensis TaxID=2071710 RepID=UPI000CEDE9D6|nr:hypothetical protein [Enterobacter sichuanensis]MDR0176291.1 hypothetical protein [Enterobacter sichuanensis]